MSQLVSRDAYAREELHRKVVDGECCQCGGTNAHGRVYRYWIERDAVRANKVYLKGLFCSMECFRFYQGGLV